jgi:hypothetical protein
VPRLFPRQHRNNLSPQLIKNRKMHYGYSEAVRILMQDSGSLDAQTRMAVGRYLRLSFP